MLGNYLVDQRIYSLIAPPNPTFSLQTSSSDCNISSAGIYFCLINATALTQGKADKESCIISVSRARIVLYVLFYSLLCLAPPFSQAYRSIIQGTFLIDRITVRLPGKKKVEHAMSVSNGSFRSDQCEIWRSLLQYQEQMRVPSIAPGKKHC